jgi:broad specificity phosphatase PhoE
MRIYIIRHGETEANKKAYLQGWSDDPLNENGILLAELTGRSMKGIRFDACISSPLSRAKETAEIVLRESGNCLPISYDDRIKEMSFGSYERLSIRDEKVVRFLDKPDVEFKFPDGESARELMHRTQDFLQELMARDDGKTYLVSTHGCALRAMLNFLYEDPDDFWHGHVPYNCCVNILDVRDGTATLTADDILYYDQELAVDRYKL